MPGYCKKCGAWLEGGSDGCGACYAELSDRDQCGGCYGLGWRTPARRELCNICFGSGDASKPASYEW
jgi:hypothetical protein